MNTNKLIHEKSPYLLQHAYNPVDWHPWNKDTFQLAKKDNKPIFLSVGYSTCYWCHVMEREVFENEEIAKLMNKYFINVKVDREERPDVDRVYMTALQSMTGSGGWPMNMFLTPELKPFYGATYVPPKAKYGRAGFEDLITQINDIWKTKEKDVIESGEKILTQLQNIVDSRLKNNEASELNRDLLENAFTNTQKIYDEEYGGFGHGNKFPRPVVYNFLLDYYYHKKNFAAIDMVAYTLRKMYEGGMYDHLAGGFHRYSVDNFWRVPHFEKMLYDQAQLISTYADTYLTTKNKFYLLVAEDTTEYVLNNLKHSGGGFYSAEDAESAINAEEPGLKEEGAFYLWDKEEIENIIGKDDASLFNFYYGVENHGNTVNDPHEVFGKKNVLYIANDIYDTGKKFGKSPEEVAGKIDESRTRLLEIRTTRPKPHLDDKILTSWNGLMVSALAKLYRITQKKVYLEAAEDTVNFININLYQKEKQKLLHRFRDDESKYDGTLEDYAFLIAGLIDLYEACLDIKYFRLAIELNGLAINYFYDENNGGFLDVIKGGSDILLKTKDSYDGAEPSGNSIQIMNILRLGFMMDDKNLIERSEKSLRLFSYDLRRLPFSSPQMLCALSFYLYSPKEIILRGNLHSERMKTLLDIINDTFIPNKILLHSSDGLENISPFISNILNNESKDAVYVCENYHCNLPTNDPEELKKLLTN